MSRRHRIGRERYTLPQTSSRGEVLTAVAGAVAVVAGTLILVWLIRPGTGPGTGGLVHRQPRASWLTILTVGAAALAAWWTPRTRSRLAARRPVALAAALALVAVAAVVAGSLWPGGLLRHVNSIPGPLDLPTGTTLPLPNSTPGATVLPLPSESTAPGATAPGASTESTPASANGGP